MNEHDYIKATNRVKISSALASVRDCLGGGGYGVSEEELKSLEIELRRLEEQLFSSFSLDMPSNPSAKEVMDWVLNGDAGTSSKTIAQVMLGVEVDGSDVSLTGPDVPHDPSDFKRCHLLLERFPQWRERLPEMAKAYKAWTPFVERWDEMTVLYEQEREQGRAPLLYKLMKELMVESHLAQGHKPLKDEDGNIVGWRYV